MTDDCSICLHTIDVSTTGCVEMSCSHKFHLKCIGTWLSKNSSCPLCRNTPTEMETLLTNTPSEEYHVIYGIGSRRVLHDIAYTGSDRIYEYARRYSEAYSNTPPVARQPVPPDADGIPGTDIRLVSEQAEVTAAQALETLNRHNGDIVNSVMELISQARQVQ